MATVPKDKNTIINKIYKSYEDAQTGNRPHLGASEIGTKCERALWYKFHHCYTPTFNGRLLRLFNRGHREEDFFIEDLKAIGCEVHNEDENGNQFNFSAPNNGHFSGSMDGAIKGIPEAPEKWHVLELKTSSDKYFKELEKKGVVETKPQHEAQMQIYMMWSGMKRAIYMAVNKNDDSLYCERIKFDRDQANQLTEKAQRVVFNTEPLSKLSERPDWYECKFCDAYNICHNKHVAQANCRTCCNSTPNEDGTWTCEAYGVTLDYATQKKGCGAHLFIPALIPAKMIDGDTQNGWIKYQKDDGTVFVNVIDILLGRPEAFTSKNIEKSFHLIGDKLLDQLRMQYDAEVIDYKIVDKEQEA